MERSIQQAMANWSARLAGSHYPQPAHQPTDRPTTPQGQLDDHQGGPERQKVAQRSYLLVTEADFEKAIQPSAVVTTWYATVSREQ